MRRIGRTLAAIGAACLIAAPPAAAADPYVTNGPVESFALAPDGTAYVGGGFTEVARRTGPAGVVTTDSGTLTASTPRIDDGFVTAAIADGAGGFYIAGSFTAVNGVPRQGLARIRANGVVAEQFDPVVGGADTVGSLALAGTTLYVGGGFTSIDGEPRLRLAAIDTVSGDLLPWNPSAGGRVEALHVADGKLFVGGAFNRFGAAEPYTARWRLAAFDLETGALTDWAPQVRGNLTSGGAPGTGAAYVWDIASAGSTLYVGGRFQRVHAGAEDLTGQPRTHFAAFDLADGGTLTALAPNPSSDVNALAHAGGRLYLGGNFTNVGGTARERLASIDTASGELTPWAATSGSIVQDLEATDDTLYVGASGTGTPSLNLGGARAYAAAFALGDSADLRDWEPRPNGLVYTIAVSGSSAFVGGDISGLNGVRRGRLAAFDPNGELTGWDPALSGVVDALALDGEVLYAGGEFAAAGAIERLRLAAFDRATGTLTGWNPGVQTGSVSALAITNDRVYVGGTLTRVGGETRTRLAEIDKVSGAVTGWAPVVSGSGSVRALALRGATLYAAGDFTLTHGELTRRGLAAFDLAAEGGPLTDWEPWPETLSGVPMALAIEGSTVYVGGQAFNGLVGGQQRANLAAVDAVTGLATDFAPTISSAHSLAIHAGTLYVGGTFGSVNGQPRGNVAAFALDGGSLVADWTPSIEGTVGTLAAGANGVYAGGSWSIAEGRSVRGFVVLPPAGAGTLPAPSASTGAAGEVSQSAATLTGGADLRGAAGTVRFEYGADAGYGSATAAQRLEALEGSRAVSARVSGLAPATTYHYRLVVDNGADVAYGADATFTTPAEVPLPATGGALSGGAATWGFHSGLPFAADPPNNANSSYPDDPDQVFWYAFDGATRAAHGRRAWAFPAVGGTYDPATRRGRVVLQGGLRIGYCVGGFRPATECPSTGGVAAGIYVRISELEISLDGDEGTLSALSTAGFHGGAPVPVQRRTVATLDLSGVHADVSADQRTITWNGVPATLTADGAPLGLQAPYNRPGERLDPIDISVTLAPAGVGRTVTVTGDVPDALGLELGSQAVSLGTFLPGVAASYDATLSGRVSATGPSTLTVVDEGAEPGYLLNDGAPLDAPLLLRATHAAAPTADYGPLGGSPRALTGFATSVSAEPVTIGLRQSISAQEPLTPGTYGKTLTFTLTAGTP